MCKNKFSLTPMSVYQKELYYDWLLNPQSINGILTASFLITGKLNFELLNKTFNNFINNLWMINSNCFYENGELYLKERTKISEKYPFLVYLSEESLLSTINRPFNLEEDLLVRAHIAQRSENEYVLVVAFSHFIIDGVSFFSFLKDVVMSYQGKVFPEFKDIDTQIKQYNNLNSLSQCFLDENKEKIYSFWNKHLNGINNVDLTFLKGNKVTDGIETNLIVEHELNIKNIATKDVKEICRKYHLTPYRLAQLCFAILFYKITGEEAFGFGFPMKIQDLTDYYYGAQANVLVSDFRINSSSKLIDLIEHINLYYSELKYSKAKYLPQSEMANLNKSINPFNIVLVQNKREDLLIENEDEKFSIYYGHRVDINSNFVIEQDVTSGLNYRFRYKKGTFDDALVRDFSSLFDRVFSDVYYDLVNACEGRRIDTYSISPSLYDCNYICKYGKEVDLGYSQTTIIDLFDKQVAMTPHKIALVYENRSLTYLELNIHANYLASYLNERYDIGADQLIALCLNRSENMLIAMLGVLKSGGAYVPIDPENPVQRISYIINDTKARLVLTDEINRLYIEKICENIDIESVCVNSLSFVRQLESNYKKNNSDRTISPNDLAYVIYTSGTTGNPKGVMIEHKGVSD